MKTQLPPTPHNELNNDIAHSRGRISGISLTIIVLLLAIANSQAISHAPWVSWVPDQNNLWKFR
jgi:hypothetical protein